MSASQTNPIYPSELQVYENNGDGTGALHVKVDSITAGVTNPSSGSTTSVAANVSSVQLLAANTSRKQASIFNDADKALYVKFGTTASATSFKVKIAAGGYFEFPQPVYTGRVDGIWESAPTGSARISEES